MQIETDRLILRDFTLADFDAFNATTADSEYRQFYPEREMDREFLQRIFDKILSSASQPDRRSYQLAVCLPAGELIGTCGVRLEDDDHHQASYGCAIARPYWGAGFAYEGSQRLLEFSFPKLAIHRLYAETNAENRRSRALAERLGFRLEGILRHTRFFKGHWWNTAIYSILREEWEQAASMETTAAL